MDCIDIKYFNVNEIDDKSLDSYVEDLKLKGYIDRERLDKISDYKDILSKKQRVLSNVLLQKELKEKCKDIYFNKAGKPLLNDVYFSISHSKDLVVYVKDGKEIGIDVEHIDRNNETILDYAFSDCEVRYIKDSFKNDIIYGITKLWTIKESVYKASGVEEKIEPKDIKVDVDNLSEILFFGKTYNVLTEKIDDYYLTLASVNNYNDIKLINEREDKV